MGCPILQIEYLKYNLHCSGYIVKNKSNHHLRSSNPVFFLPPLGNVVFVEGLEEKLGMALKPGKLGPKGSM